MNILSISVSSDMLTLHWSDQSISDYPFIWLRDIDPLGFHPQTKERIFDLTSVDFAIQPTEVRLTALGIELQWPEEAQGSIFSQQLLFDYRQHCALQDPATVDYQSWQGDFTPPRHPAKQMQQPLAMAAMLKDLKRYGLVIVTALDSDICGEQLGDSIGFKRESNFGVMFEVINKPEPNNLAYTSVSLPLHTDLPNQELPPGYQFLHCIANEAQGGESILADGFAIAEDMREHAATQFNLLSSQSMPFRFHDNNVDIRFRHKIIGLDEDQQINSFIFNAHLAAGPDFIAANGLEYYSAYRELISRVRRPQYPLQLKLQAGEMMIFDNRRVLHGRKSFDPSSGNRHLRGYYIDRGEIDSRLRIIAREQQA
ncbi:MAG: TauD/TfdA family dioxygenase [Pseudomonadales bacterium]|nr:TauD/TfdA family dioxygenase [Pseudomonadales bacterium]NRA16112.1 TauD/TfdA family dioxygenase [Oceanospirillaceae bacterium]